MSDFETQIKQMAENRIRKEQEFYGSKDGKLHLLEVDFKCWCHSKGKFYNLTEEDFKAYKKEFNITLDFSLEMLVYEKWFGYVFEYECEYKYDDVTKTWITFNGKWKTKEKKGWVLNENK